MFHSFDTDISAVAVPRRFTCPFCYTPHALCLAASRQVAAYVAGRPELHAAAAEGKMFGVLAVKRGDALGFVAAFSGQIDGRNTHPYFVPPVFDILADRTFFTDEEAVISQLNSRIYALESSPAYTALQSESETLKRARDSRLTDEKEAMRRAKQQRDILRQNPQITPDELARLLRESQFQKAEYKRLERRLNAEIESMEHTLAEHAAQIQALRQERRRLSAELQRKVFSQFVFMNARGERKSLVDIFADERRCMPPAAAGECAGPRLLQYAYVHGLAPVAMAEFWYGASPRHEIRTHGSFYPACTHKCEPILHFMLQGLDVEPNPLTQGRDFRVTVVHEDDAILVIDKPAGMLSVPGKIAKPSACEWAQRHCGHQVFVAHRLDMETSGLLVIAKTPAAYKDLQRQFAARQVQKQYVALLSGTVPADSGTIALPLRPDYEHRPCQTVDAAHGKPAVTRFTVIERKGGRTKVLFAPATGRTHQLRVHAAHPRGLACPIVGDNLYGAPSDRMYLHAQTVTLRHPLTGQTATYTAPCDFVL